MNEKYNVGPKVHCTYTDHIEYTEIEDNCKEWSCCACGATNHELA